MNYYYYCYLKLNRFNWVVEKYDTLNLHNGFCCGYYNDSKFVGFHCKEDEIEKFVDNLKEKEIKSREKEIKKLQLEIEKIKKVKYPNIKKINKDCKL